MKSSEELEREGEERRARINETLDELRARMTPGQIVDQVIDYARGSGGGTFVRNLGQQIVERPLPIVLVGTGLLWLMVGNGRARRADGGDIGAGELRNTAGTVRDTAARSGDAAGSLIDRVRARAASTYESTSRATRGAMRSVGDSTASLGRTVGDRSQQFVDFAREQPLVLAGLGVAVGAAIGAALPVSDAEDRLMGEASDDMKERMRRVAGKVKDSARGAYEDIRQAAASDGDSDAHPAPRSDGDAQSERSAARARPESGGAGGETESSAASALPPAPMDAPTAVRGADPFAEPRPDRDREPR